MYTNEPPHNTAPKPTRHWRLDKSYQIVQVRLYEFVRISHLVKYVRIGHETVLHCFAGFFLIYITCDEHLNVCVNEK